MKTSVFFIYFIICIDVLLGNNELEDIVKVAFDNNFEVKAAQHQLESARAQVEEMFSFYDPLLGASISDNPQEGGYNKAGASVGGSFAIDPGIYLKLEAMENYLRGLTASELSNTNNSTDKLFHSKASAVITIPLLRDRGFNMWRLSYEEKLARVKLAKNILLSAKQKCRFSVEQAYISFLEAAAYFYIAEMAEQRSRKLLEETIELVRSKAMPEYQIFSTRADLALRQQERISSYELIDIRKETLDTVVGTTNYNIDISNAFYRLILWANAVEINDTFSLERALYSRGDFNALMNEVEILKFNHQQAKEMEKSDLNLNLSAIWQGEHPDRFLGTDKYLSYRNYGAEILLVWSRRLGNRGEKARVRSISSLINEKMAILQDLQLKIKNGLNAASRNFSAAAVGMDLCAKAVEDAKRALEAENEKFRLGEGRSRNVLDSQKDLTDALKRQILVAIDLLKAYSSFNYYSGYCLEE